MYLFLASITWSASVSNDVPISNILPLDMNISDFKIPLELTSDPFLIN